MRRFLLPLVLLCLLHGNALHASIFSQVHGVVHDPQHRPIAGAHIALRAANSSFTLTIVSARDGSFALSSVPLGDYILIVTQPGFANLSGVAVWLSADGLRCDTIHSFRRSERRPRLVRTCHKNGAKRPRSRAEREFLAHGA